LERNVLPQLYEQLLKLSKVNMENVRTDALNLVIRAQAHICLKLKQRDEASQA